MTAVISGGASMALSSFIAFSFPPPRPNPIKSYPNSSPSLVRIAALNSERRQCQLRACSNSNPTPEPEKPVIQLEFIGPTAEADGSHPADSAIANSGEKLLRSIMLDNKIELYAAYGKLMNCGGGGSCGTCIVEIVDGKDLLNERTDTEKKHLKKKPETWRLACQTIVGNKENSGKVVVRRMPQWKKLR